VHATGTPVVMILDQCIFSSVVLPEDFSPEWIFARQMPLPTKEGRSAFADVGAIVSRHGSSD